MDVQIGYSTIADEIEVLTPYLEREHVYLAIDPEYDMSPGEIPGQHFGSSTGEEIMDAARTLSELVEREDLPPKVLVIHADGFGTQRQKIKKYTLPTSPVRRLQALLLSGLRPTHAGGGPRCIGAEPGGSQLSIGSFEPGLKVLLRPPGHQFQSPRMRMVAGTRSTRIIVASTKTATARPRPTALVRTMPVNAKAPVTTMMIAAAEVMMPAVATSPLATLAVFESPFS